LEAQRSSYEIKIDAQTLKIDGLQRTVETRETTITTLTEELTVRKDCEAQRNMERVHKEDLFVKKE